MEHTKPVLLWVLDHPLVWLVIIFGVFAILELSLRFYRSLQFATAGFQSTVPALPQAQTKPSSLKHNVQFVGFKLFQFDPDLPDLALGLFCFENVLIPGKPIENFHSARLRVIYRDFSSGETIAEAFPARWHDSPDAPISICADENKCAVIASCIGSKWATDSLIDAPINPALEYGFGGSEYKHESIPLPLGRIKIKATLIGEQNLSLPPIEGILTLGENGNASFVRHATA